MGVKMSQKVNETHTFCEDLSHNKHMSTKIRERFCLSCVCCFFLDKGGSSSYLLREVCKECDESINTVLGEN